MWEGVKGNNRLDGLGWFMAQEGKDSKMTTELLRRVREELDQEGGLPRSRIRADLKGRQELAE